MYLPQHFSEQRVEELDRIIKAHPLGALVTYGPHGLDADHIPFLLDRPASGDAVLLAHVARANPVWQNIVTGSEVMVIFRGAQGYISPNWYPGKQPEHRRVPTWAYEVVHVHGAFHVHDDEKFVRRVVARLTREHESRQCPPWKMGDAPTAYLNEQLSRIVGIEVRISRFEGKRKLNQNYDEQDRQGAICGLQSDGNHELAAVMHTAFSPQR